METKLFAAIPDVAAAAAVISTPREDDKMET